MLKKPMTLAAGAFLVLAASGPAWTADAVKSMATDTVKQKATEGCGVTTRPRGVSAVPG
jgi:hypothetical protein